MSTLYESFYTMFSGLYNDVSGAPPQHPQPTKPADQANKGPQPGQPLANGYPNGAGYQQPPPNHPGLAASPQGNAMRPNGQHSSSPQPHQGGPPGGHQGGPQGPTQGMRGVSPQPNIRNLDADKGHQSPMANRNQGAYGQDPAPMQTPQRPRYETAAELGRESTAPPGVGPPQYVADKEDLLDQHVAYYLRHHPDVHRRHHLVRKRPGVYELNNREVLVEWQYATEPGGQGHLVVLDGPLRQPFSDYMECSEFNAEYDTQSIGSRSALHMIPKDKRMSFGDQHKVYTRLEAMKVAKEQALVRETHADYVNQGRVAPNDLMDKYKKTITQKLGPYRRSAPSAGEGGSPPAASSTQNPVANAPSPMKQGQQPAPAQPNHAPNHQPAPAPAQPQPQYGMQPHTAFTPSYTGPGTTKAIPPYGNPAAGGLVAPQGLFQQNMGGVQQSSYRPPVAGAAQAYPMRWG